MAERFITSGQGNFYVQTEVSEPFEILTCVGVGDLPLPQGDLTPQYCPDPEHSGRFVIDGYIQGEPGAATTTLERPLSTVANWLLEQRCEFNALVAYLCDGVRAISRNFQVAFVLFNARVSDSAVLAAAARQPADNNRVMTNASITYADRQAIHRMEVVEQTLDNTAASNGIAFLPEACESDCAPARDLCEVGYMGLDGTQYNSEVKLTEDSGANWAQTATDPFLYDGGDAGKPVLVELADGEHRVIVPRISVAVGEPAEIAYSDDSGATWTNVYVGTFAGQFITKLFMYQGTIWACASDGYIYVSTDLGESWTAQESGVETSQTLRDIVMYTSDVGYCVGDTNVFLFTINGGTDWASRTGPAALTNLRSVAVNSEGYVFVGAADGVLYYSIDEGQNWLTRRDFGSGAGGSVDWIAFDRTHRYFGGLIYNTAAPVGTLYRSFDGGASWEEPSGQTASWNSGLNDGWVCDANNIFVAGEAHNGTTFVARAVPSGT